MKFGTKNVLALSAALATGCIFADASKAAVIASYDFQAAGVAALNSTDAETNSNASVFSQGTGLTFSSSAGSYQAKAYSTVSEADAATNNDYVEFTATASAGYELDLTSLDLGLFKAATTSPDKYFVRSSVGGYAASIASGTATTTLTNYPVTLTGANFQNLTTITFRVFAYGGNASKNFAHDNIILNGSVNAIPEPATFGLMGVGGLLLAARRRRAQVTA